MKRKKMTKMIMMAKKRKKRTKKRKREKKKERKSNCVRIGFDLELEKQNLLQIQIHHVS